MQFSLILDALWGAAWLEIPPSRPQVPKLIGSTSYFQLYTEVQPWLLAKGLGNGNRQSASLREFSVQVCSLMWPASMQSWVPAKNAGSGSRRAECFMTVLSCQFVTHILTLVEAPACTLHALANGGTGFSQQHSSSQTSARPLQLQCSSERLRKGRVMGGGFVPFWRYADRPNSSGRRSIQRSH